MDDLTRLLRDAPAGDPPDAARLLPLVYGELRRLAAHKLAGEAPGQTLQPTALVHEAYLRVAGADPPTAGWTGRTHFFAAAAEAMRRILIDNARRRAALRHGGGRHQIDLDNALASIASPTAGSAADDADDLIALDTALARLESEDQSMAALVKLHYFVGLSLEEAADALGISRATAYRHWTFVRAWLRDQVRARNP